MSASVPQSWSDGRLIVDLVPADSTGPDFAYVLRPCNCVYAAGSVGPCQPTPFLFNQCNLLSIEYALRT